MLLDGYVCVNATTSDHRTNGELRRCKQNAALGVRHGTDIVPIKPHQNEGKKSPHPSLELTLRDVLQLSKNLKF